MKRVLLKTLLTFLFLFLLFPQSSFNKVVNKKAQKFKLNFGGDFTFDLPISPDHIKLNGNFQLFNFSFKGDLDVFISKRPFRIKIVSNKLVIRTNKILKILKRLNVLKFDTSSISVKGFTTIQNLEFVLNENGYFVSVGKIYGTKVFDNLVIIKDIDFKSDADFKKLSCDVKKILFGNTKILNLYTNLNKENLFCKVNTLNLNLSSISDILFKLNKGLKSNLLDVIKNYLPVKDLKVAGNITIRDFETKVLAKNNFKNLNFSKIDLKLINSKIILNLIRNTKSSTFLTIKNNPTQESLVSFRYENGLGTIKLNDFFIITKNFWYPLKNLKLKFKSIAIPYLGIKNNFNINFNADEEFKKFSNIKFEGKVELTSFDINLNNNSIKFNLSPIDVFFDKKVLDVKLKSAALSILKELSIQKGIYAQGNIKVSDISCLLDLSNDKKKILFSPKINNFNLQYDLLKLKIVDFSSDMALVEDIFKISNLHSNFSVNSKGKVSLDLCCKIPISSFDYNYIFDSLSMKLLASDIVYKNINLVSLNLLKKGNRIDLDYNLMLKDLSVKGKSYAKKEKEVFYLVTRKLDIKSIASKETIQAKNKTKSFRTNYEFKDLKIPKPILNFSKKYDIAIDKLIYFANEMEYEVDNLKIKSFLKNEKSMSLSLGLYFCQFNLNSGVELNNGHLETITEIKTISAPIDLIIGCFLTRAPVYIKGDTSVQISIMSNGKDLDNFVKNIKYDGFINIDNGIVLKLSNLGKKVSLILKLLNYVKLNPSKIKDALPFDKLVISFDGDMKKVNIKSMQLNSPIMGLSSFGSYEMSKKALTFNGVVKKGFIEKSFKIVQRFDKKEKEKK